MEKIWLKSYPPGVPGEIAVDEFASIGELFERSVRDFRARSAYVNMGRAISYAELDRLTRDFAAYCQSVLGLAKGARIAVMMPNVLQCPVCIFGALRAGYTVVNCNPLYTAPELEHQLRDSGAEAIVILENFAHVLQEVVARTGIPVVCLRLAASAWVAEGAASTAITRAKLSVSRRANSPTPAYRSQASAPWWPVTMP